MKEFLFSGPKFLGNSIFLWKYYRQYSELKFLSKELSVPIPSLVLSRVMSDHGYHHVEQIGLLTLLHINGVDLNCCFEDLQQANLWLKDNTQLLLRKGERWSADNLTLEKKLKKEQTRFIKAITLLGMLTEIKPDVNTIKNHVAVLPGALESRIKQRILVIRNSIVCDGLYPKKIIAATGYRKLLSHECPVIISEKDQLESNMIAHNWKKWSQNDPVLSKLQFGSSIAPLKVNQLRSTTVDTARALKNFSNFQKQNVLIYVEQPYALRFYSIFRSELMKDSCSLFLYTKKLDFERTEAFIFQDEIARRVYYQYPLVERYYQDFGNRN